jgi:hypothetical protein
MATSKLEDILSNCDSTTPLYEKLEKVQQFRLITLLPGRDTDHIECVLKRHTFHDSPKYEALSYEWGKAGRKPETIVLNGQQTKITHNLWLALGHLRQTSKRRVLWVDAPCIDQSNNEERSHQVSLMAIIYSGALRVISWLGLEHEDIITKSMVFMLELFRSADEESLIEQDWDIGSREERWNENVSASDRRVQTQKTFSEKEIIEFIKHHRRLTDEEIFQYIKFQQFARNRKPLLDADIHEQIEVQRERERNPTSHKKILSILKKRYYDGKRDMSEMKMLQYSHKRSDWEDLARFWSVEYWKRLWIVQEVVLARDLRIQCGESSIEWFVMGKFLACLKYTCDSDYRGPRYIPALRYTPAAKLGYFRSETKQSWLRDLILSKSLATFRNAKCSDPRDKIYGLLGLSNDRNDSIYPDYNRSLLELYELVISIPRFRTDDELVSFS